MCIFNYILHSHKCHMYMNDYDITNNMVNINTETCPIKEITKPPMNEYTLYI